MIRQLNSQDNDILMKYIKKESELNLFAIGDIENFGYDRDFLKFWGEFNEKGELTGFLLRYYKNFVFYSRDDFDVKGFYEIISGFDFNIISGEKSMIEKFEKVHDFSKKRYTYFCKLDHAPEADVSSLTEHVVKLESENIDSTIDGIVVLRESIREFDIPQSKEQLKKNLEGGSGRAYYIEEGGKIVSIAETTAENSLSAMVVGVCTYPDYRCKGYASACLIKLCTELVNEGKTLCLFYDNPEAGKIYKRLGFKDIGMWCIHSR